MRPAGLFVLRATDAPIVAFAGGSGITPVISLVKSALAHHGTAHPARVRQPRRGRRHLRRRARAPAPESCGRLTVHHHHDSERGFLDAPGCAALVDGSAHADFYICGPGPYMDIVDAGLSTLGVGPAQGFIERFVVSGRRPVVEQESVTESPRDPARWPQAARSPTRPGDTILEAARRAGLSPPFSCEAGAAQRAWPTSTRDPRPCG